MSVGTERSLITANEAGSILGLLGATIRYYIREGKLKAEKYGNEYLIDRQEFKRFAARRAVGNFMPPRKEKVG